MCVSYFDGTLIFCKFCVPVANPGILEKIVVLMEKVLYEYSLQYFIVIQPSQWIRYIII